MKDKNLLSLEKKYIMRKNSLVWLVFKIMTQKKFFWIYKFTSEKKLKNYKKKIKTLYIKIDKKVIKL